VSMTSRARSSSPAIGARRPRAHVAARSAAVACVWGCSSLCRLTAVYVVVERSRAKGLASLLGCAVFVLASLAIIAQGSALTLVVGGVGLLTFAGFGIGWTVMLLRDGPGLVVDDTGFDDNSSALAVGRVLWTDVTSVSERKVFGTTLLVVGVRDPEAYLARLGRFARLAATGNRRRYGSPVILTSVGLSTSSVGLSTLLREGYERSHLPGLET
jgi:hypothetical protein